MPAQPRLEIVIASTRPGRVGEPVARWFEQVAVADGRFDVGVADLAEIGLPLLDEPNHPRLQEYLHDHTKAWSARVAAADAFAFVTPEYNHGMAASLKNAIDFLHNEWRYKPVGFVSYGGVSAGTRGVQMAKQVVAAVSLVPIVSAVPIPFVRGFLDDDDRIVANDIMIAAAEGMLDELHRVEAALRPLRSA